MQSKTKILRLENKASLFCLFMLCFACATSKNTVPSCHQFGLYAYCEMHSTKKNAVGIDGETGTIQSSAHVINYDHSSQAFAGPQNKEEYFMQTFRSYHYLNYFDSIHIDKKVQKLFRDSVKLISLKQIPIGTSRCKSCNFEAMMKFKQFVSPVYFFATSALQEQWSSAQISYDTIQNFVVKTYQNDKEKGAYIKDLKGDKQAKKLSLVLVSGDFDSFIANVKSSLQKLQ